MKIISSISPAIRYILKDKVNFIFAIIPVVLGIIMFYIFGAKFYDFATTWGDQQISLLIQDSTWGTFLNFILKGILWAVMLFTMNFTFVLCVSLIASPFNDLISRRVEKLAAGEIPEGMSRSIADLLKNLVGTLLNEMKKIGFILVLGSLALVLNFFPAFVPVSIMISALLLAIEFLDYSWSRHEMDFSSCLGDIKSNVFTYAIAGSVFMFLLSIPIVNLMMLPFGVSYFTTLWVSKKRSLA